MRQKVNPPSLSPTSSKEVVGASSDSHSFDVERETNLIERLTPVHSESPLHLWLLFGRTCLYFYLSFWDDTCHHDERKDGKTKGGRRSTFI